MTKAIALADSIELFACACGAAAGDAEAWLTALPLHTAPARSALVSDRPWAMPWAPGGIWQPRRIVTHLRYEIHE